MKMFCFKRFKIFLLVLAGLCGLTFSIAAAQGDASGAVAPEECCRCHLKVCEERTTKRYVHAPLLENHCAVCHVKGGMPSVGRQAVQEEVNEEIEWFVRDSQENNEHWFELPAYFAGTNITLMANAGENKVLNQEINLPTLDRAERFPLQQGEITISDLRIVEVKKGVFLSARIAWKTDRITDAQIFYGEGDLRSSTALDNRWATDHEILVAGLDAGRLYRFVVVSRDISGNKAISQEMMLSTRGFYSEPVLKPKGQQGQVVMKAHFYQEQGRFFARFATSHPVAMRLGRNGEQALRVEANGVGANRPQGHFELTDPHALTITVCVGCHPQSKGEHSHPVDIRPKAGMHIPPDYRTMADGRLSCMTCHQAHASDNEYRLTRAKRKDLCLGCHRNFG
jgi:predicted CXXCH cytochrome family protein